MVKQNTLSTSTIQITKPNEYEKLDTRFRLIRYVIPDVFRTKSKKDRYKLLHVELRAQLIVPYRTYEHDDLDGPECLVIYALYPREQSEVASIVLSFLSNDPLAYRDIGFHQVSLFNLVKLLQADFFDTWPHFASMGEYYVHAKSSGKDWHICLAIKIQGDNRNVNAQQEEQLQQEFWVTSHAKYFNRPTEHPDEFQKRRYPYYKRQMKDGYVVFEQIPYDQIDSYKGELFQQYSKQSNPARLPYHAQNATELLPSKGYLLHQFTTQFVKKLQAYGIPAQLKTRTWSQYVPPKHAKDLPQQLKRVYLYDSRQNQTTHPISAYQDCLKEHYEDYDFIVIETLEEAHRQPVLILQDTSIDDYLEGGLFTGIEDPYKTTYRLYPDTPKQSINVNEYSQTNFSGTRASYLDYPMIALTEPGEDDEDDETETGWAMQFQVSFHQLYLKNVVINQKPVSQFLPVSGNLKSLMSYIYIRKQTYRGTAYHVAVRVDNDRLQFHDLRDPEQKAALSQITEVWGYDWFDVEELLLKKYHKNKDEGQDVTDYDLILMPECAIELETVDETVLYKYDEIARRLRVRQARQPVESFQLLPHYDRLKPKIAVSQIDLEKLGLLGGRAPDGDREVASMKFWQQLQEYDQLLEDVRMIQSRITYDEFVGMRRNEIGRVFKFPRNKKGEYITKQLLEYYKVIWEIGGFKSDDVQISKGIWFDLDDLAYMVGDVNGFKDAQDRAHLVRRFDPLLGKNAKFDMQVFLEATAVQFIRHRQYTVYPYPFYLIEKYIQDILYHQ